MIMEKDFENEETGIENSFIAVDFETATNTKMACQIGITIVKNGVIQETITRLIQPPFNIYDKNVLVHHHVRPNMTESEPTFDLVWDDIKKYFEGAIFVAHNVDFDKDVLEKNLNFYGIGHPDIKEYKCTCKLYGRANLEKLCSAFDIQCDNHHDAGFDSECCAQFYLNYLNGVEPIGLEVTDNVTDKRKRENKLSGDILKKDLTNAYQSPENPFFDRRVVVTGVFEIERKRLGLILKRMGADINSSISKNTNFVLIGEDPGYSKLEKLEKLEHDGFKIQIIYEKDLQEIFSGNGLRYHTPKENKKDIDLTISHYDKRHIVFEDMTNVIAGKELFLDKGITGNRDCFSQIIGNLGAYCNYRLDKETQVCILSMSTIINLRKGIKNEVIIKIQNYYNENKSNIFDYDFISDIEILDYCKRRCETCGDKVTMRLYDEYVSNSEE